MASTVFWSRWVGAKLSARPGAAGRVPGEPGFWVIIFGDLGVFTLFFALYLGQRAHDHDVFVAGERKLAVGYGAVMTLLLLTSSLLVVRGVRRIREKHRGTGLFVGALACAAVFVWLKVVEWFSHVSSGDLLGSDGFWSWYFVLTGLHLLHVLLGMVLLGYLLWESRDPQAALSRMNYVECSALFWHMVDLLWVLIFPLLYFMR